MHSIYSYTTYSYLSQLPCLCRTPPHFLSATPLRPLCPPSLCLPTLTRVQWLLSFQSQWSSLRPHLIPHVHSTGQSKLMLSFKTLHFSEKEKNRNHFHGNCRKNNMPLFSDNHGKLCHSTYWSFQEFKSKSVGNMQCLLMRRS